MVFNRVFTHTDPMSKHIHSLECLHKRILILERKSLPLSMKPIDPLPDPCLTPEERNILSNTALHAVPVQQVTRFNEEAYELKSGSPVDATRGLDQWMCVDNDVYFSRISKGVEGMLSEVQEFVSKGDPAAKEVAELLHYILYEKTSEKQYPNGVRDKGRGNVDLTHFLSHKNAHIAQLTAAEVVALRLYTTPAFKSMNEPLRDIERYENSLPCPLPVCARFAYEGIKKLRAVQVKNNTQLVLWRGARSMTLSDRFKKEGGTELAFMSTTTDPEVAIRYSLSGKSLIFKIVPDNFMSMGAELQWLSAFPGEAEILYPPLTYLKPTGRFDQISVQRPEGIVTFSVVEVVPYID